MKPQIEAMLNRARAVLVAKPAKLSPLHALLRDDDFCVKLMTHRLSQGMRLPEQNASLPASPRLAFLHALAAGGDVSNARVECDGLSAVGKILAKAEKLRAMPGGEEILRHFSALIDSDDRKSYWLLQPLFHGEDKIRQGVIPLRDSKTGIEEAVDIVHDILKRQISAVIIFSDMAPELLPQGFIQVGTHPAHIAFPEMRGSNSGADAALLHYEIDHPGGDFLFFNTLSPYGLHCEKTLKALVDGNPLNINEMPQMMAAFLVPAGDTQVTLLPRDGCLVAAVNHDLSGEADEILSSLADRGMSEDDLRNISGWLRTGEIEDDDLWEVETAQSRHSRPR
ncbi:hypothetical protein ACEUZ9_000880 [Paracoccus litorisediminis]|uniref:hypothetical protein n=1 Tax=Paracoccus litorisediminis TaxID=2006130 RepID=UPI003730214C